jgi:23S rRNA (uracil1939-C5)-methyltransferase
MNENKLVLNQEIFVTIKRLGINGEGIGYYKRLAIFIDGAIPGEEVEAVITSIEDGYSKARIKKIKKISPNRVKPDCPYYDRCGGCQLQHINYETQLREKHDMIYRAFERYYEGDMPKAELRDTIGMDHPWVYRNKNQLPVRYDGNQLVTGLYAKQSNSLVYIDNCLVENQLISKATKDIKAYLSKYEIIAYNPKINDGVLRHLVVRGAESTNEVQVTLVLFKEDTRTIKIAQNLINIEPVVSVNYTINSDPKALEIFGETTINIAGKTTIDEKLGDITFSLLPTSFFQLNSSQAEKLYQEVAKAANLTGKENVIDGFCGVGAIGLWLSKKAKEVRGIDFNPDAIQSAKETALKNDIKNTHFYSGNLYPHLDRFNREGFKADVFIVNPPRSGLDIKLIHYLQDRPVKKLIYVSCNPSTLAKNVSHLQSKYKVRYIQPIDMFPQTANVEAICLLERI